MEYGRPRYRRRLPWLVLSLAAIPLVADDAPPPECKEKARIELILLRTDSEGATKRFLAIGPVDLAVGEKLPLPISFAVAATGSIGPSGSMSFELPATLVGTHALVWTANVEVLSVSTNQVVLNATWERLAMGENGGPAKLAGDSGSRVTLREGERVLLDFADRAPAGAPLNARNFALELSAEIAEDPSLEGRQISYDLWLMRGALEGKETSRHLEVNATQGKEASFQFPHDRLPALAGRGPDEAETELQIDVRGSVRGRLRQDGSLDLSLGTDRTLWYVSADGSGEHVVEGGEKRLHLKPGETIRVELPGAPRNTQRKERYARDMAGHTFALVVRAQPLP